MGAQEAWGRRRWGETGREGEGVVGGAGREDRSMRGGRERRMANGERRTANGERFPVPGRQNRQPTATATASPPRVAFPRGLLVGTALCPLQNIENCTATVLVHCLEGRPGPPAPPRALPSTPAHLHTSPGESLRLFVALASTT